VSNQPADVVIGQPNFTTNSPTTASASVTAVTADAAIDPTTGKLFVVDAGHHRILRFSSSAAATSGSAAEAVFGQPDFTTATANTGGLSATSLNDPSGIFVDSAGRLWVADTGNNRVLRFDGASGTADVTTLTADQVLGQANFTTNTAGTTLATLSGPADAFLDGSGNLWVADTANNRVLRFDAAASLANGSAAVRVLGQANGTSNTAATTQTGMSGPTSVAVDASGTVWVADTGNNRVLRFDSVASDGIAASVVLGQVNFTSSTAAITQSGLDSPTGVAIDSGDRLWVADTDNNRILWFDDADIVITGEFANGVLGQANFITATAGLSATALSAPAGVSLDASGRLWAADSANNRVLRFTAPANQPPVISLIGNKRRITTAASRHISGFASDPDGIVVRVEGRTNTQPVALAKGTTSWRFHVKKMKKGINRVRLQAVDDEGLRSNPIVVTILRRVPPKGPPHVD
jgi:sugar lactone lactonase YvrE